MKKSLIALAALSAFATAAQAQTATVYGRIDQGFRIAETTDGAGKVTETSAQAGGGWTSSRLGVNLSEDLGGGLRAFATWESGLNGLDTGTSPSATSATSLGNIRQAFAGVQGSFGRLSIGNQYLPEYFQGITNLAGTVNGGLGYAASDLSTSTFSGGMRRGELTQTNNIQYVLPKFGATTVSVVYGTSTTQSTGASGGAFTTDTNTKLMGISANYEAGKLNGTLSYSQLDRDNLGVTGSLTCLNNTPAVVNATNQATATACQSGTIAFGGTAAVAAGDTKQKNITASGIYDFGAVKAFAYYADRELSGTSVVDFTTYNVGLQAPMGKIVPFVMMGEGKQKNSAGEQVSKPEFYQVGATYNFSKRTLAYGYVNKYKDKLATGTNAKDADNITAGLVHQF
jgi:predicted porin